MNYISTALFCLVVAFCMAVSLSIAQACMTIEAFQSKLPSGTPHVDITEPYMDAHLELWVSATGRDMPHFVKSIRLYAVNSTVVVAYSGDKCVVADVRVPRSSYLRFMRRWHTKGSTAAPIG